MRGRTETTPAHPAPHLRPRTPKAEPRRYPPGAVPPWVALVREDLCESWLVKAPKCQPHRYCKPRAHFANLILTVLAGIHEHFPEGVQFLDRHGEFLAQQVHQTRHARRAA